MVIMFSSQLYEYSVLQQNSVLGIRIMSDFREFLFTECCILRVQIREVLYYVFVYLLADTRQTKGKHIFR